MKATIKIAKIGNSQGIRLSKELLRRYRISDTVEIDTTPDAIILRPPSQEKLDWANTYRQMAAASEDWAEWDALAEDGLTHAD